MRHLKTSLAVIGAATVLILAGNTIALAATGQGFLLGKANSAGTQTTLTRTTNGPVLKLTNKNVGGAPLVVNGTGRVANLNADKVDGYDSTAMRNRAYVFQGVVSSPTLMYTAALPVPNGTYSFSYSAYLESTDPGSWAYCQIVRDRKSAADLTVGVSQFNTGTLDAGLSGAGLVTRADGDILIFRCEAADTFATSADKPLQITLSPTTVVGGATLPNEAVRQR